MTATTGKPNKLAQKLLARQEQQQRAAVGTPPNGGAAATQAGAIQQRMRDDQIDRNALVLFVTQIEEAEQARKTFTNLDSFALDIEENGQLQPIVVIEIAPYRYRLKHGARRLRAIRDILKHDTILARVAENAADATRWRLSQLSENLQREDYKPFELAREFASLKLENNWNNKYLADKLHLSESWVYKKLSLLESPAVIQDAIENDLLSETEYFNNKAHYNENVETVVAELKAAHAGADARDATETKEKKPRIASVSLPLKTAQDLADILCALAKRHRLNPIEIGKKPSKKEIVAILTSRTKEIKKHL